MRHIHLCPGKCVASVFQPTRASDFLAILQIFPKERAQNPAARPAARLNAWGDRVGRQGDQLDLALGSHSDSRVLVAQMGTNAG
jgi:hypothetical protein